MERAELAFIPTSAAGHLSPMVEFAKTLTSRDDRVSATIFIMELPFHSKLNSYTRSLLSNPPPPRVRFVHLPLDGPTSESIRSFPVSGFRTTELYRINKCRVEEFYSGKSTRLPTAFVVDMLCTVFADVASAFGVPTYVFFTGNACSLSLMFHLQGIKDFLNQDTDELKNSDLELSVPGFVNPVPSKVLPYVAFDKEEGWSDIFFEIPRKLRKTKGILVNTFTELEPYALECLSKDDALPPIYPVGSVLNLNAKASVDESELRQYDEIMAWLDNRPQGSVVFLCFGSLGTFCTEQVAQIARALEQSGHGFLWAMQRPPPNAFVGIPSEYKDLKDVLPQGFLDRTKEIGKVIGWAPQVAVLSHQSVGGFVSHCGWNSLTESLWCGVPVATWPLYSEQQMNAFEMIKELGLAVEIKFDYNLIDSVILSVEEIERGIKELMDEGNEVRKKVKAMSEASRTAVEKGGSSYAAIGCFIEELLK